MDEDDVEVIDCDDVDVNPDNDAIESDWEDASSINDQDDSQITLSCHVEAVCCLDVSLLF